MKQILLGGLAAAGLMLAANAAIAKDKTKDGGVIGNSYGSQMVVVNDNTIRITTRKRISGDLNEVNTPGTTMAKALQQVSDAALVRAGVEGRAMGYHVLKVVSSRNLSATEEKRNASNGQAPETGFTFAPGHYTNDVILSIEVTVQGVPGAMPENPDPSLIDVDALLKKWGIPDDEK
ncbi:MAG TPA: hypothetical protein VMI92_06285 [Steroidobacteraceae bacterium]|nr:hypothetical protein [Steroidobacteraceae bacterium]